MTPPREEEVLSLSAAQRDTLRECEQEIAAGLNTFLRVGQALLTIRNERLYRERFRTFDEYCRGTWQMSRSYAYRLVNAAAIATHLSPMGDIAPPTCERQVRPLLRLRPDAAARAWKLATDLAGGQPVKLQHVIASVSQVLTVDEPADSKPRGPETTQLQHLLRRELRRLQDLLQHNETNQILIVIERMKLLIEQYGAAELPAAEPCL